MRRIVLLGIIMVRIENSIYVRALAKTGRSKLITIKMPEAIVEVLDLIANRYGRSRSEIIREAIISYLSERIEYTSIIHRVASNYSIVIEYGEPEEKIGVTRLRII